MFLQAQSKPKLVNVEKISTIEVAGRAIVVVVDGVREVLATYTTKKRAQVAFDEMLIWLNACRRPEVEDLVYRLMWDTASGYLAEDEPEPKRKKLWADAGLNVYELTDAEIDELEKQD